MVININVNYYVYDIWTSIYSPYYFTNDLMCVLMMFTNPVVNWKSLNVTIFHLKASDVSLHHSSTQTMSQAMSVNSSGFATVLLAVRERSPYVRSDVCVCVCVRNPALCCSARPWGYRIGSRWTCHTRRPALENLASLGCPETRIYPLFLGDPEYQCHRCHEDPGSLWWRQRTIWQLHKICSRMLRIQMHNTSDNNHVIMSLYPCLQEALGIPVCSLLYCP